MSDPFLDLKFLASEFGCSVGHLRNISLAQRGLYKNNPFPMEVLSRYPQIVKGPSGKLGMWASKYRRWRNVLGEPLEAA